MSALDALQEKKPSQNQLWRLYWANHQVKYMVHCNLASYEQSDISIKGRCCMSQGLNVRMLPGT